MRGLGHDHGHRLADEVDRGLGEELLVLDDPADLVESRDVGRGEDRDDAGQSEGRVTVSMEISRACGTGEVTAAAWSRPAGSGMSSI